LRIIIVGGGIMGLCSAWTLQRAGYRIVLYGFKFGAVIGEVLATTLDGARTPAAMTAWAAGRA
jgi:glycine/D-amino acid oxidase-like deaminating enzyme